MLEKLFVPKPLKKGDTIGLIGTAGIVPTDSMNATIESIKKLGFQVVVGESCSGKHGYFSGPDHIRASDINKMFADKTIDGIFCIRGGYGSQRLMDKIDYKMIKDNPKFFCGYSDITALHIAINQLSNLVTYHTPMPSTELIYGIDEYTFSYYDRCLKSLNPFGLLENPEHTVLKKLVGGSSTGVLTGGNLCLITASMGTPYEIDTKDKIIFIEEIEEEPYRIDRMLMQMKLGGKFKDCAGIILGAFTKCDAQNPEKSLTLLEVFKEIIVPENKPTVYNFLCGHCMPTMSIPMGCVVELSADNLQVEVK